MEEFKNVIAKNIIDLRRAAMMTQLDLAERLNYSDKAVSKWERAESVPDISVLKAIADLFGVSVDYLITEDHTDFVPAAPDGADSKRTAKAFIIGMSVLLVWLLATFVYILLDVAVTLRFGWLAFLYAVPLSFVVWLVLNSVWFAGRRNWVLITCLSWTALASIHVTLALNGLNLWMLYILGVPWQAIVFTWAGLRHKLRRGKAVKKESES